jgi:endonuclease G
MNSKSIHVRTILFFALLTSLHSQTFAKVEALLGDVSLINNPNLVTAEPLSDQPEIIISRPQYVISYNKERRAPNYVAWQLSKNQIGNSGRSNAFAADPDLEKYLAGSNQHAVLPTDYTGSCFDRGHQIPSADRSDVILNNEATFYMSNMVPQTAFLNRVIWEQLEVHTRQLVQNQNKKIYVIAGPIYDEELGSIGPLNDIKIPSKDFKLIIILDANQTAKDINANTPMIAVIMPNTLEDGSRPVANTTGCAGFTTTTAGHQVSWEKYQTTVEEIQKLSGITFFPTSSH